MDASLSSIVLLDAIIFVVLLTARHYFRSVRVPRPPVGVFNLRDITFTFVVLVILPPLYLQLPNWLISSILVVFATALAYLTVVSAMGRRVAIPVAAALAVGEVVLTATGHSQSTAFVVVNDVAVGLLVVGVCNIWAQSGIHARDVALFSCAVAGYDLVATWLLPLMTEFFTKMQALPFAPILATGTGPAALGIGMGDLLFIALWPLVAEKAFSRRAGRWAAAGTLGCVVALGAAFYARLITTAVPAMVFIGPVIACQLLLFRRRYRVERSAGEYEAAIGSAAPAPIAAPTRPVDDLVVAANLADSAGGRPSGYLAVHNGILLAVAATPGEAVIAARKASPSVVPVLVLADCATTPDLPRAMSRGVRPARP